MGLIAREIERRGIATVSLSSAYSITRAAFAPRAVYLDFPLGRTAGKAGDAVMQRDIVREVQELLGAGDEVRLAVQLDEHADAPAGVDIGLDHALAGRAVGALRGGGDALLAQQRAGAIEVAFRPVERALGVHHSGAGLLAEPLHILD